MMDDVDSNTNPRNRNPSVYSLSSGSIFLPLQLHHAAAYLARYRCVFSFPRFDRAYGSLFINLSYGLAAWLSVVIIHSSTEPARAVL